MHMVIGQLLCTYAVYLAEILHVSSTHHAKYRFFFGAIEVCADLLSKRCSLPINRETSMVLAEIASCKVIMSTHDGYYKQIDRLAMGSPPAPHLANGWMSQFEPLYARSAFFFIYTGPIL